MIRIFASVQACFFLTALAQPIDARDELILPMNPPKKVSPAHGTHPIPQRVLSVLVAPSNTPTKLPEKPAFKITKTEGKGEDTETMEIQATISRLSSKPSDPSDVRVLCHVYESDAAGKIFKAQSQVNSTWTSPPIDWKESDIDKARETLTETLSVLVALQRDSPDWQPRVVDYRINSARKMLAKIEK